MKAQVQVELLGMEDPTFEAGVTKVAKARLTNPTTREFTYRAELYLGMTKASTSGVVAVTIPANSYLDVNFTLVMPLIEASYNVFLDVWYDSTLLKHYQATEDVVIEIAPVIEVGPIIW